MEVVQTADRDHVESLEGCHLAQLTAGDRMSIQHFRVEPGGRVEEHSHPHEQAGYLISGSVVLTVDGEEYPVGAETAYSIPGDAPHAAENRGDEVAVGIEIFSPSRPNPPWLD